MHASLTSLRMVAVWAPLMLMLMGAVGYGFTTNRHSGGVSPSARLRRAGRAARYRRSRSSTGKYSATLSCRAMPVVYFRVQYHIPLGRGLPPEGHGAYDR